MYLPCLRITLIQIYNCLTCRIFVHGTSPIFILYMKQKNSPRTTKHNADNLGQEADDKNIKANPASEDNRESDTTPADHEIYVDLEPDELHPDEEPLDVQEDEED